MILTETHIIPKTEKIDSLLFKSKNLYNNTLYHIKQSLATKEYYTSRTELEHKLQSSSPFGNLRSNDYYALPGWSAQTIVKQVYDGVQQSFKNMTDYQFHPSKYKSRPQLPTYKHSTTGRYKISFYGSHCKMSKHGTLLLPNKLGGLVKPQVVKEAIKLVTISHVSRDYVQVSIMYDTESLTILEAGGVVPKKQKLVKGAKKPVKSKKTYASGHILGLDLGIKNLVSGITTEGHSLLVNGGDLKAYNLSFNKHLASLKSQAIICNQKYTTNLINKLYLRRSHYVKNYLHTVSKFIIDYSLSQGVTKIVIGLNKGWKQNASLGKTTQTFVQIPHSQLIQLITYKGEMMGVEVVTTEESYTSKIDHLAFEKLGHHEVYLGKRKYRGLFMSSTGVCVNADINGAIGMIRKVSGDDFLRKVGFSKGLVNRPGVFYPVGIRRETSKSKLLTTTY